MGVEYHVFEADCAEDVERKLNEGYRKGWWFEGLSTVFIPAKGIIYTIVMGGQPGLEMIKLESSHGGGLEDASE